MFGTGIPDTPPWTPALEQSPSRQPAEITKVARTLHASGVRRIWSTLFDFRDWASYVYVPIIVPILVLTPYFSVKYYEYTHRMNQIIQSLAQGSKDVEQMSRLMEGPVARYVGAQAAQLPLDVAVETKGFTILQDLRMIDLRRWFGANGTASSSYMYGYRRLKIRRDPENRDNHKFRVSVLAYSPDTQVRFPPQELTPTLYSQEIGTDPRGQKMIHWTVGVDLRKVPPGDTVELIYEHISPGAFVAEGMSSNTLSFDVEANTIELTRWLLMPEGKEYKNFLLIRYRSGEPDFAEKVKLTTEYLPQDREILAFKLLALQAGYTYELSWFYR